jgi:hypothetical protein
MKFKAFLLLLVCVSSFGQRIKGNYEFQYRENRTPTGWDKVDTLGEVIFYEDKDSATVSIVTSKRFEHLYVKSRQIFIRQDTFLYTLVDAYYKECSLRIVVNETLDTLELYYYSDRKDEKYYRLKLKKCK